MNKTWLLLFCVLFVSGTSYSQIVLLGDNAPHANVNDGDFSAVWDYWRNAQQSPFWTTRPIIGDNAMGLHYGTLFSSNDLGIADSKVLSTNPDYQKTNEGDVWLWSFGADLEYVCKGTISLSLVFGKNEVLLAEKVKLIGSDKSFEHFSGSYVITREDVEAGLPFVRVTFYSEQDVKVYLDYVNISVVNPAIAGPKLKAVVKEEGIALDWKDDLANKDSRFYVYRLGDKKQGYQKLGESQENSFLDSTLINGVEYSYVVTRMDEKESGSSNKITLKKKDEIAPLPPTQIEAQIFDTEIKLSWEKSIDRDVASYTIYRGDETQNKMQEIAHGIKSNSFLDYTPLKDFENSYVIYAFDYSGNKSIASEITMARVPTVSGTSFSDLIQPMPIHKELSSDLWGVEGVIPRDPDNGIEDPQWSYWGGRPVKDKDSLYHMLITRWPANALKGHWEWPNSTVAHVVAEQPCGPYVVEDELAYDFHKGLGHNPDIILLNDGTYMLYSLIDWEATLFTSENMNGPWKRLGTMTVDWSESGEPESRSYRFYRNLSGVQLENGRFLFVSKAGAMMLSANKDPLGPYKVLTKALQHNEIIPEKYRNSNYEDPVLWKDEVQFHMIINAFWDYRAIYLRSPDGFHWKFNPGTAYTPNSTSYENGTQTRWYKLERPHVLTDEYGRATHLSLAVIDVPKANDLSGDRHNSKNIILPLTVNKRIKILNKKAVNKDSKSIKILLLSEPGFDAQKDVDLESLRFGASEEVNYGRGSRVIGSKKKGKDLLIEFEGEGNGINAANFVCKLIGKTKENKLIVAYSRLKANP